VLSYHPALDVHHAAFRMVRLLVVRSDKEYDQAQLRILDFYLLFPALITRMRLPRHAVRFRRSFARYENRYWFSGAPRMVFTQLAPLQQEAIDLLVAKEILDVAAAAAHKLKLAPAGQGSSLVDAARSANDRDAEVVQFLVEVIGGIPTFGPQGLKARSQLMEFRYDTY